MIRQTLAPQRIDDGFYRRRFSRTGVARQQNVRCGFALKQRLCVIDDDLALAGVIHKVGKLRLVRVADRHDLGILAKVEHTVFGVNAVAVLADVLGALCVARFNVRPLR